MRSLTTKNQHLVVEYPSDDSRIKYKAIRKKIKMKSKTPNVNITFANWILIQQQRNLQFSEVS